MSDDLDLDELGSVFGNFTDKKPHVITELCLKGFKRNPVRCVFCGLRASVGDVFVWIFTNDKRGPGGNPFACGPCHSLDGDPRARLDALGLEYKEVRNKFWWWLRRSNRG